MNKNYLVLMLLVCGVFVYAMSNYELIKEVNQRLRAIETAQTVAQVEQLQAEAQPFIDELKRNGALSGDSYPKTFKIEATLAKARIQGIQSGNISSNDEAEQPQDGGYLADMARAARESMASYVDYFARQAAPSASSSSSSSSSYRPAHDIFKSAADGDVRAVQYYLDHGVNVDGKNAQGSTPLHIAIQQGNNEMVELLLMQGADATIKNNEGKTALKMINESNFSPAKKDSLTRIIKQGILNKACQDDKECTICLMDYEPEEGAGPVQVEACLGCSNLLHSACYRRQIGEGVRMVHIKHPNNARMTIRIEEIAPCPSCREPFTRKIIWVKPGFDEEGKSLPGHDELGKPTNVPVIARYIQGKIDGLARMNTREAMNQLEKEILRVIVGIGQAAAMLPQGDQYRALHQLDRNAREDLERELRRARDRLDGYVEAFN